MDVFRGGEILFLVSGMSDYSMFGRVVKCVLGFGSVSAFVCV